jgi:murein DD-endopeptidase MepM/ murein hydrolase activator NlpD
VSSLRIIIPLLAFFIIADNAFAQRSLQALNAKVDQGGVLIFKISPQWLPPATTLPGISIFGKNYLSNSYGDVIIGVGIDIKPGKYIATFIESGLRSGWDYEEIEVVEVNFPVRKRSPFIPNQRWIREHQIIEKVFLNGYIFDKYFDNKFVAPLERIELEPGRAVGDQSSPFGDGHGGVDLITLDRRIGRHERAVRAIGSGKVALVARSYMTEGNMVILDHGSGIFSVYMHLSKFLVRNAGEEVKAGETIAISGQTGSARRGGPHLHFAIKVGDVYVDPLKFIDSMNQY